MTPINFVYWLQGFLEIAKPETLTKEQIEEIKNHLSLVLRKETPVISSEPYKVGYPNPFTNREEFICFNSQIPGTC